MDYNYRDLSNIINSLISYRILRTKVPDGTRFRPEEKELANLLLGANINVRNFIDEYLAATGFRIIEATSSQMPGIPLGGTYFLLTRDIEESLPQWFSLEDVYSQLQIREQDTKETTRVWFFMLWLNTLILLYSQNNRPITAVSEYISANFTKSQLIAQAKAFIEEIRQTNVQNESAPGDNKIKQVLLAEEGQDILKRVNRFLGFLTKIFYLEEEKDESETAYAQTLLMAIELKENYQSGLGFMYDGTNDGIQVLEDNLYEKPSYENADED